MTDETSTILPARFRLDGLRQSVLPIVPGLALAIVIAVVAIMLQRLGGFAGLSPLIVAMVLGILLRNTVGPIMIAAPGIAFSMRRILRFAIVLLGFQITLGQIAAVGITGLAVVVALLVSTFVFTKVVARVLGVDAKLGELIAAGTSVCGASAIIACNTVTRASDEDVAYAVACISIFGSIAMLAMPLLAAPFGLTADAYGFWAGASIHEVGQVVGAAFAQGEVAGQTGTVVKLSRVMLLAPLILSLGFIATRRGGPQTAVAPVPWFAFGFIAVMLFNSQVEPPLEWRAAIATLASFLLAVALAATGLETDIRKLRKKGVRPLLLGAVASLFIAIAGLLAVIYIL